MICKERILFNKCGLYVTASRLNVRTLYVSMGVELEFKYEKYHGMCQDCMWFFLACNKWV